MLTSREKIEKLARILAYADGKNPDENDGINLMWIYYASRAKHMLIEDFGVALFPRREESEGSVN